MGDKTGIEWCNATWNPIRGCTRVSRGCDNCYAERTATRFSGEGLAYDGLATADGNWTGQILVVDHMMNQPIRWTRPRRIFVNSMSDLFHANVPLEAVERIYDVMGRASRHQFQVLTKRPRRMLELVPRPPHPNVLHGVSVEDQAAADLRIPTLLEVPSARRFLSVEPLLGPVDLRPWLSCLDWVIVGGESGPGARPMDPEWVRDLREQCVGAGVPFFFKQWGGVNKKAAGKVLDGRTWCEFPDELGGRAA